MANRIRRAARYRTESSIPASEHDLETPQLPSPSPAAEWGVCSCFHRPDLFAHCWPVPVPKVWRKTRLLTNEGMLKILCLDVEVLLVDVCSNPLNNGFVYAKGEAMSLTRRNLCLLLPAALVPAVLRPASAAAQEGTMPSAMYPFERLPIRTSNSTQIRDVLKGKLATGE